MLEMFKGMVNSPETTITNDISESDTLINVLDETSVPEELPNLMTLGTGTSAETVKVLEVNGNALTVERGFQGVARSWNSGTVIARNFTEYDYNALVENVKTLKTKTDTNADELAAHKAESVSQVGGVHGLKVEEGTFTPYFYLGPEDAITYSQQTGKYMKVGNLVHLSIRLTLTSVNIISTGRNLRISGLPFAGTSVPVPASFVFSNLNIKSSGIIQGSIASMPEIVLQWVNTDGDGFLNMKLSDLKSNTDLRVSLTYKLD